MTRRDQLGIIDAVNQVTPGGLRKKTEVYELNSEDGISLFVDGHLEPVGPDEQGGDSGGNT